MDAANSNKILITGAQGFIGRAVRKLLEHEGCPVLGVDQVALDPGVGSFTVGREILLDITDGEGLRRIFETREIAGVIHLAAILPTVAQREPLRATNVNVIGSANLLEMAREFGVRRFVFASSLSAYGTCPADQIVSEESNAASEDVYGASKLYVEQLGTAYRERFGLEFASLRIGRVVGPGARSATSAWRSQIFELLQTNEPFEITLPYVESERLLLVHIGDVARAFVTLLRADHVSHAVYNAPCQSALVKDLKQQVERLNSNIEVRLGDTYAKCNPRLVDWTRFRREFEFSVDPIFETLARGAG